MPVQIPGRKAYGDKADKFYVVHSVMLNLFQQPNNMQHTDTARLFGMLKQVQHDGFAHYQFVINFAPFVMVIRFLIPNF